MSDLEDLHRRRPYGHGHVPLCVCGEKRVDLPVARDEDNRVVVWIVARQPRAVWPEHAEAQPADPKPLPCADGHDGDVLCARRREGCVVILALGRDTRVEHGPDLDRVEHVGGAADVVALRMGEDERGESLDT